MSTKKRTGKPKVVRRKKKDTSKFGVHVRKVLKQVHPDTGLSGRAGWTFNQICKIFMRKVICASNKFLAAKSQKTLNSKIIMSSATVVLPSEIARHAISEITKSVTKYDGASTGGKYQKISSAQKAGLLFPVMRIKKFIKKHCIAERVSMRGAVALAAATEYIIAEIIELSGNSARDNKRVRIKLRDIKLAVDNDMELQKLFCDTYLGGGVTPHIQSAVLKKKRTKRGRRKSSQAY